MNTELAMLKFSNLLEIANISAQGGKGYERQEELVTIFREKNLPFLAIMPMRHRYRCDLCQIEQGEAIFHFENPGAKSNRISKEIMWGPAKGAWAQIETAQLHRMLAHGEKVTSELQEVLSSVR